ncbi:hypothetical protein CHS0354_013044 [Potamilus streckersoni]|uniref:Uncharacterized protein n=1 Tax=Potamilus streckersoni TaxID=2493646 RepID=A0AAE0S082_9BIVA|nr:hypothetical protein CHS0354_013044 [Potamilus streckersoni]
MYFDSQLDGTLRIEHLIKTCNKDLNLPKNLKGTTLDSTSLNKVQVLNEELPLRMRRQEMLLSYSIRLTSHPNTYPTKIAISKCNIRFSRKLVPLISGEKQIPELRKNLTSLDQQEGYTISHDKAPSTTP